MDAESSPPARAAPARSQRQALVTAALLALAAGLAFLLLEVRSNSGHLQALAGAACRGDVAAASQLRSYLYVVLGLAPPSTFAFAGYLAYVARRARREGVFPPPGTLLSRPTQTFTGVAARRVSVVVLVFSATIAGLGVILTMIGLRMLALLNR